VDFETPDAEVNPFTGELEPVQNNSLVQMGLNKNLVRQIANEEINKRPSGSGSGDMTKAVYDAASKNAQILATSDLDTDGTLAANSDSKVATQKAVKTYADTKQSALGFTPENVANKDTDATLAANSDTKYASQKATKTYADTKLAKTANLSDVSSASTSFDNIKQTATSGYAGVIKLTNDLGGTSNAPTVPGLVPAQISTLTTIGHSWTATSDTQAYKQANFGYTGIIADRPSYK